MCCQLEHERRSSALVVSESVVGRQPLVAARWSLFVSRWSPLTVAAAVWCPVLSHGKPKVGQQRQMSAASLPAPRHRLDIGSELGLWAGSGLTPGPIWTEASGDCRLAPG